MAAFICPMFGSMLFRKKSWYSGISRNTLGKESFSISIAIALVYQIQTYNTLVQNPWLFYIYKWSVYQGSISDLTSGLGPCTTALTNQHEASTYSLEKDQYITTSSYRATSLLVSCLFFSGTYPMYIVFMALKKSTRIFYQQKRCLLMCDSPTLVSLVSYV